MLALRTHSPGPDEHLSLEDVADPEPGPGEVVVEVEACGVCRTDLQITRGEIAPHGLPRIPGHQVVGRVAGAGPGVESVMVGDRVGIGWLATSCGACRHCRRGRQNLCEDARFTGWDRDGGFATITVARADHVFPLPDHVNASALAPLLCGGVIGYRALNLTDTGPGDRLGLYGFGSSARSTLQVAIARGVRCFVVTRSLSDRSRAVALGAEWAGGYDDRVPEALDAAITFAPAGSVVVAALAALDRGGSVAINAIHLDGIPAFDYDLLWWERQIRSVANYTLDDARHFLDEALRLPMVTDVDLRPLTDGDRGLIDLEAGRVRGSLVLAPDPATSSTGPGG